MIDIHHTHILNCDDMQSVFLVLVTSGDIMNDSISQPPEDEERQEEHYSGEIQEGTREEMGGAPGEDSVIETAEVEVGDEATDQPVYNAQDFEVDTECYEEGV